MPTPFIILLCLGTVLYGGLPAAHAAEKPPVIKRISVSSSGVQGNGDSFEPAVSANGRYVAFRSKASNLVIGDSNGTDDIFVHDLQSGQTTRVSVDSSGVQANGGSYYPAISDDGRYITFYSLASNLVATDTNNMVDIFRHDTQTGATILVSVANGTGNQGNGDSYDPVISANGNFIAYYSWATNLVTSDTNNTADIFFRDIQAGTTTRINVGPGGTQGNDQSNSPSISADGRYVAYYSEATNLVPGDTNRDLINDAGGIDVFVRDRQAGTTTRVSVDSNGNETNVGTSSFSAVISADGRYVAFRSWASNLVAGDTNALADIFVHDRQLHRTSLVSIGSSNGQGNGSSYDPALSSDGRYVAFSSAASNLVPGDTNGVNDMFVHDQQTGKTTRVCVDANGVQANDTSYDPPQCSNPKDPACPPDEREVSFPSVSTDGSFVAFSSLASNLVAGDTNGKWDIFVRVPQFSFPWVMFLPAISGGP